MRAWDEADGGPPPPWSRHNAGGDIILSPPRVMSTQIPMVARSPQHSYRALQALTGFADYRLIAVSCNRVLQWIGQAADQR
jgi:hypothetical protein